MNRSIAAACSALLLAWNLACQSDRATPAASPTTVPSDVAPIPAPPVAPAPPRDDRFEAAARYSAEHGGLALVVVEGDGVVFAEGQNGHSESEAHPLYTATESFWGIAAIAADLDGLLDLDEPVSFTLGEFDDTQWKRTIRIRQLLQYSSGLEAGVWPLVRDEPDDHFARALTLEAVAPPGQRFQFGPSHLAVFGALLARKLEPAGVDPVGYLEQRILEPIGMRVSGWRRDPAGNPDLAGGASATAREWAKFGMLLRDNGRWRGQAVVAPAEVAACFEPSPTEARFGLAVWLNPTGKNPGGNNQDGTSPALPPLRMAAGTDNQRLYAIPSVNLVVVRFGNADRSWRDREFLSLVVDAARERPAPDSPRESISDSAN